ncbi:unnamed protein product [Boreogadus saida]
MKRLTVGRLDLALKLSTPGGVKTVEPSIASGEAAKEGVLVGSILFGSTVDRAESLTGLLGSYQADDAGTAGLFLANSGWGQMDTSLKCGEDQMQLKAMGPGSSYFMLDMGGDAPMVPNQAKPQCGYSMKYNSLGLVLMVPYNGCRMTQDVHGF